MSPIVPDYIEKLAPYVPGKPIEEVERELGIRGSIKLASNENPLGPSPLAIEAIKSHLEDLYLYPDANCYYLRTALARELHVEPEQIVFGNGSNEVIELVVRTLVHQDEEIVYAWPSFVMYRLIAVSLNLVHHEVPLTDYTHDVRAMLAKVNGKTKAIIVANPNNPTGTLVSAADFVHLVENTPPEVFLVADEAYFEYITDPEYPNSLNFLKDRPNLIVVRTFSKAYGLAGLRVGYGIMERRVADYVNRLREPFNVNRLAQVAAEAALKDVNHVGRSVAMVREGLRYMAKQLAALHCTYVDSHANFLLVRTPMDAADLTAHLQQEGVIVRPMAAFGLPQHIRVTVGTRAMNERFIRALRRILGAAV
jgi:histidinol-phosphate aminotransferase